MSNEKISDLTAIDRLRTGNLMELEDATNGSGKITVDEFLLGPPFDTTTQLLGFTAANTMEVESNTRAARLTARPDETNNLQAGWTVGRYAFSSSQMYASGSLVVANNTTGVAAVTNGIHLVFAWVNCGGICVPKRITGFMATGAQGATGTAGATNMQLVRAYGLGPSLGAVTTDTVAFPPSQGGNSVGGVAVVQGTSGLKASQPPSQATIHIVPLNTTAQAYTDVSPIGVIEGGRVAAAAGSTQFLSRDLYDYRVAEQPIILVPGTGFQVTVTMPAGATSQGFHCFVNMTWDEWTPVSPGDK